MGSGNGAHRFGDTRSYAVAGETQPFRFGPGGKRAQRRTQRRACTRHSRHRKRGLQQDSEPHPSHSKCGVFPSQCGSPRRLLTVPRPRVKSCVGLAVAPGWRVGAYVSLPSSVDRELRAWVGLAVTFPWRAESLRGRCLAVPTATRIARWASICPARLTAWPSSISFSHREAVSESPMRARLRTSALCRRPSKSDRPISIPERASTSSHDDTRHSSRSARRSHGVRAPVAGPRWTSLPPGWDS